MSGTGIKPYVNQFARRLKRGFRFRILNPARYISDNARCLFEPGAAGDRATCRLLIISDGKAVTSEEQLNPFNLYRVDLRRRLKVISLHLLLEDVVRLPRATFRSFDAIGLKLSFSISVEELSKVRDAICQLAGKRPVIYLDGDDDPCIMHPEILSWVDVYVKKHVFRDRSRYLQRFVGKSNLTDFVHREYGHSFAQDRYATECLPVAREHLDKITVGWNLALDSKIISLYSTLVAGGTVRRRSVDVMFRGNVPKDWLHYLRKDVEPSLRKLQGGYNVIIPRERVNSREYYREMLDSKICVSPFGYGEICWRDFEAILCGCLLVKPDMSHLETKPDVFKPNETYVPVRWDYSDLEEKCRHYLRNDDERERIVCAAFEVLANYYGKKEFLSAVSELLHRDRSA